MSGHQYSWVMARWDKDLPLVWLLQTPSCSSFRSDSNASKCTQSKYCPEKERLYNFLSLDIQNRGAFLYTFSASDFSSSNMSLSRNSNIWSIQLSPNLIWWTWSKSLFIGVGVHKSSTSITRGKSCAEEVARVAKESAWVFPFLGIYEFKEFKFCLYTSNLTQIFLHSCISCFQFPFYLAYNQSWIREHFHCFSTHFLDHHHSDQ